MAATDDKKWKKLVLDQQSIVDKCEKEHLKARKTLGEKGKSFSETVTVLGQIIRGGDNPLLDQAENKG